MDNINVQRPFKGMFTDFNPIDQPKESYRYALNAITEGDNGNVNFLSTEQSNFIVETLGGAGTIIIGSVKMNDDSICIFAKLDTAKDYIGILDKHQNIIDFVETSQLDFSTDYPIYGVFRMRRNDERIVYWVDSNNKPRYFNFDKPYDFYSVAYQTWLNSNSGTPYVGEQWDEDKFSLIRSYDRIPEFINVEVLEGGDIPSGSYSIAIQLVDDNLNPTEWITTSNPVNIYVDPLSIEYPFIRGSRKSESVAQNFPNSNKSIKWTIGNIDPSFPYYRVAILQANMGDGNIYKALVSPLNSSQNVNFVYSGNDADFSLTPVSDIQVSKMDIASADHITQLENRLILAGIKGKQINFCDFQKYASNITPYCVIEQIVLDDVNAIGNPKNPIRNKTGYMPNEVYSFGIVYVFNDGTESPAFHIPGVPDLDGNPDPTNGMQYYECPDNSYIPIHTCLTNDYWGVDIFGNSLVNEPIRHHRFPKRTANLTETISTEVVIYDVLAKCKINYDIAQFDIANDYRLIIHYIVDGAYYTNGLSSLYQGSYFINAGGEVEITLGNYSLGSNVIIQSIEWSPHPAFAQPTNYSTITFSSSTNYYNQTITTETKLITTILGIQFLGVERPHPDVIGYRIVRNERTDDDKLIVDNAIIGPLMNTSIDSDPNNYHSFGLLMPNTDKANFSTKGMFVFAPEHQFRGKKLIFDQVEITGLYNKHDSFSDNLYVEDVRPGTTFNSQYEKGEDPDGFDLNVAYRSNRFDDNVPDNTTVINDTLVNIHHLSAAGSKLLSNGNILFNASADNKIIIAEYKDFDSNIFDRKLYSASLISNNTTAYNNFINRTYYKEHENIMKFTDITVNSDNVFNGDAYTAPITVNSSTYWDTIFQEPEKKSRVWLTIVGGFLVIAGIALIATGLASGIGVAAIAYGISLAASGMEFEVMKKMFDEHYEAGLKTTLEDTDNQDSSYTGGGDDRICWFVDRLDNLYVESSINMAMRSGHLLPVSDFLNSPVPALSNTYGISNSLARDNYESYLTSKFTVIDRERNSGRLYTGYPISEFYDMNFDYLRKSNEKSFYYLPIEYDCCSEIIETFNKRIHYSEQSYQEEKVDNYRRFLPNNYRDIEGEFGRITNVFRIQENLYIHTEEALFHLPQNLQERSTQELVSFIGTGEFFAIPPRKTFGVGSRHKQATIVTPFGVFYVSDHDKSVIVYTDSPTVISNNGMQLWFKNNITFSLVADIYDKLGLEYTRYTNVISDKSIGIHAGYDSRKKRFLLTKTDYVPLVDYTIFTGEETIDQEGDLAYDQDNQYFGLLTWDEQQEEMRLVHVSFNSPDVFEDRSWTISFSMDNKTWTSFHSYIPRNYIFSDNFFFTTPLDDSNSIYQHNRYGKYLNFYGTYRPHIIDYISLSSPMVTRIWNYISIITEATKMLPDGNSIDVDNVFFTEVIFYNLKQCSGLQTIDQADSFDAEQLMLVKIQDSNTSVIAEKKEGVWSINDLRNFVDDYTVTLFSKVWEDTKDSYPIDKVVNPAAINYSKDWKEIESLRDKFLGIRLIFTNFAGIDDVQLTTNYSFESEQPSIR